jgi:hypothetical protein
MEFGNKMVDILLVMFLLGNTISGSWRESVRVVGEATEDVDGLGMGIGTSTTQLIWWKYVLSRLHVSALAVGHHQVYTNVIRCCTGVVIS